LILLHRIEFASIVLLFRSSPRYPERFPIRCLQPAPLLPAEYLLGVPPIAEAAHRSPRKILQSAKGSSAETEVVVEAFVNQSTHKVEQTAGPSVKPEEKFA
jgi:hypothetical protein